MARPRKPTSFQESTEQVDGFLDRNLPDYVRALDKLARQGDRQALTYLIDRRLGKPVERREDVSDKLMKSLENLANRLRKRQVTTVRTVGQLPPARGEDGVVEGSFTDPESEPAAHLRGEGS